LNTFQQFLAIVVLVLLTAGCGSSKPELRVYKETNYIEIQETDKQIPDENAHDIELQETLRAY